MKWFKKKDKKKKPSRATRYLTVCLWRLFKKIQLREKIAAANQWADSHRKQTAIITISVLSLSLVFGILTTIISSKDKSGNYMNSIEDIQGVFAGFQQIQNSKDYQKDQISDMLSRGKSLKNELDSLIRIQNKTHDDSSKIMVKYKQLEIITKNLKN